MEHTPDVRPVPDPTLLTTAALKQSIENLKELLEEKIKSNHELFQSQIDAVNKLKEEKFAELKVRLDLIERQRIELKEDAAVALASALESQKALLQQQHQCSEEAVRKAEDAFNKQLGAVKSESETAREGLSERINNLKERIDRGAGKEQQREVQQIEVKSDKTESVKSSQWMIGLFVIGGIALAALLLNLATFMSR